MELSSYLVSWVVTYVADLQPAYLGVLIYLPSTMDIPVDIKFIYFTLFRDDCLNIAIPERGPTNTATSSLPNLLECGQSRMNKPHLF